MSLKNKSVMVTGGAGFIGSHLVDRLIQEGPANLVVVDNFFLGKKSNLAEAKRNYPALKVYDQDAADYEVMKDIVKQESVNVIFNLAIIPLPTSLEKPRWTYEKNNELTLCLCEIARGGYYDTLIHFSSSEAYGSCQYAPMDENHPLKPTTAYGASKAATDLLVLSYISTFNIDASIVRPFNNYGTRQNKGNYAGIIPLMIRRILSGEVPVIYGDGEQTRDYIYVTDTADVAVKIYNCPESRGKVVNVASGSEISIKKLAELICKYMDYDKDIAYEKERPGDVRRLIGDVTLAKNLVGFQPRTGLERGLKLTVEWFSREDLKNNL
ncbi:dTDP-glucose 4,6-dehydratase [Chloroflexota bacterium]